MQLRGIPWAVLSLAMHAALVLVPPAPVPVSSRSAPERAGLEVDVQVGSTPLPLAAASTTRAAQEPSDAVSATGAAASPPRGREARDPRARGRPDTGAPRDAKPVPRGAEETPLAPQVPAERAGADAQREVPSLNPRAVAQAAVDGEPTPDAGAAPSEATRLNRAIMAGVPRHVDTIPDPVLKAGPRGGYVYQGRGFDAVIRPDGSVDLRDRFGSVHLPLVPYRTATGEWRVGLLGGTIRLYEWLDRKLGKNDPYASEKRWFLTRTRALREKLERDHYGSAAGLGASPRD